MDSQGLYSHLHITLRACIHSFFCFFQHLVSTCSVLRRKKQSSESIGLEFERPEFNKWCLRLSKWVTVGKLFNPSKPDT